MIRCFSSAWWNEKWRSRFTCCDANVTHVLWRESARCFTSLFSEVGLWETGKHILTIRSFYVAYHTEETVSLVYRSHDNWRRILKGLLLLSAGKFNKCLALQISVFPFALQIIITRVRCARIWEMMSAVRFPVISIIMFWSRWKFLLRAKHTNIFSLAARAVSRAQETEEFRGKICHLQFVRLLFPECCQVLWRITCENVLGKEIKVMWNKPGRHLTRWCQTAKWPFFVTLKWEMIYCKERIYETLTLLALLVTREILVVWESR